MDMTSDDIIRLCAQVSHFSKKADLRWKGLPIIAWEFADLGDFHDAKMMLMLAIEPMMVAHTGNTPPWQRIIDPSIMEIDCYGVTFRLICKQKMMTRYGPFGAADMR